MGKKSILAIIMGLVIASIVGSTTLIINAKENQSKKTADIEQQQGLNGKEETKDEVEDSTILIEEKIDDLTMGEALGLLRTTLVEKLGAEEGGKIYNNLNKQGERTKFSYTGNWLGYNFKEGDELWIFYNNEGTEDYWVVIKDSTVVISGDGSL